MITEDYVSFETATLLKEKGFNAEIDTYYSQEGELKIWCPNGLKSYLDNKGDETWWWKCIAPPQSMAMKWLKEVHSLYIELYIIKNYDKKKIEYTYTIQDLKFPGSDDGFDTCKSWDTPEQADEEAIKYCLEKLI